MNIYRNRKHIFHAENLLSLAAVILFLVSGTINNSIRKPVLKLNKQDTAVNLNKDLLVFLSAGNKRLFTDLLWVQTLLESDLEHYKENDLNSWMYLRFLTISQLDPLFFQNYLYGGQYLSIVKDDLLGAVDIYSRGLNHYPDNYSLNFHIGFTYYFELNDYENGKKYLQKIAYHPRAPEYIKVIASKLNFEVTKDYDLTLAFIADNLSKTQSPEFRNKLKTDYYALKAERDLKCLNAGRSDCERRDADGNLYIFHDGKFRTQKAFVPYRLKRKGDQSVPSPVNTIE